MQAQCKASCPRLQLKYSLPSVPGCGTPSMALEPVTRQAALQAALDRALLEASRAPSFEAFQRVFPEAHPPTQQALYDTYRRVGRVPPHLAGPELPSRSPPAQCRRCLLPGATARWVHQPAEGSAAPAPQAAPAVASS